jgi:hypothetical protein
LSEVSGFLDLSSQISAMWFITHLSCSQLHGTDANWLTKAGDHARMRKERYIRVAEEFGIVGELKAPCNTGNWVAERRLAAQRRRG